MRTRTKLARAIFEDGRTARELAVAAGVDPVTVSLAANGRRAPRLETSLKLAKALNRAPHDLGLMDVVDVTGGAR